MYNALHDWRLLRVDFDLAERRASLTLQSAPDRIYTLAATKVRHIDIPQHNEWGPSYWILNASLQSNNEDSQSLSFEMQSGDNIIIHAKEFSFDGERIEKLPSEAAEGVGVLPLAVQPPTS